MTSIETIWQYLRVRSPSHRVGTIVLFAIFAILFGLYTLPIIVQGIEDKSMILAFSTDEAIAVNIVNSMLKEGNLSTSGFHNYGAIYFYLALLPLLPYKLFFPVTDSTVILSLRGVCVLFGLLSIYATFYLARKMYNFKVAILAASLLAVTPEFLKWSVSAHPDVPQLFFVIVAVTFCYSLAENYSWKKLLLASFFAGLAFGTKYAGLFLLPVVWLSAILSLSGANRTGGQGNSWRVGRQAIRSITGATLIFAAVFAVSNPDAVFNWQEFQKDIVFEMEHINRGNQLHVATPYALEWVGLLLSDSVVGNSGFLLFLAALFLALLAARSAKGRWTGFASHPGLVVVFAWIVIFLSYLVLRVNWRPPRYLLPIVPFILIFASYTAYAAFSAVTSNRLFSSTLKGVVLVAIVLSLWPRLTADLALYNGSMRKVEKSVSIRAGKWLLNHYPPETRIVYDAFSYIPSEFVNVTLSWGQTEKLIDRIYPHLIVTNSYIFEASRDFYKKLQEGQIYSYALVKDFGAIKVYEREEELDLSQVQNLLANPSFLDEDKDGIPDGWKKVASPIISSGDGMVTIPTGPEHGAWLFSGGVAVEPGQDYVLLLDLKLEVRNPTFFVALYVYDANGKEVGDIRLEEFSNTMPWAKRFYRVKAAEFPADAKTLVLRFGWWSWPKDRIPQGTAWVRDVTLFSRPAN